MDKPRISHRSASPAFGFESNPCNMHLLQLAEKVKEGLAAVGVVGMRFNTISIR